jgi:GTPase-activating protein BEM2
MKRVAQLKLLCAEHSLLGLGGMRIDSDLEGETIFRLFGGEIIVKVAKEPQDSRPNSFLENGPTLTRKPSKALGIRVTPQAASTLERKPSTARRQSLPLLTTPRHASAEPSVNPILNDSSVPVVIIAGTVERLVDVLVRGLDYVTAATADDNGEMALRDRKSRSMRLDKTEFSKTWWNTYRSFVTPDIFIMVRIWLTSC